MHGRGHLDQTGTSFTCAAACFTASSSPLFWGEGLSLEGLRHFGDNVKHRICMLSTNKARTPLAAGDTGPLIANVTTESP